MKHAFRLVPDIVGDSLKWLPDLRAEFNNSFTVDTLPIKQLLFMNFAHFLFYWIGSYSEIVPSNQGGDERWRDSFQIDRELADCDVAGQVLLVHSPEGPQKVAQRCSEAFGGVNVPRVCHRHSPSRVHWPSL